MLTLSVSLVLIAVPLAAAAWLDHYAKTHK
jgi:hypothetical protein